MLKRDTIFPLPYADVEMMADAQKMPIAWPYQRVIHTSVAVWNVSCRILRISFFFLLVVAAELRSQVSSVMQ